MTANDNFSQTPPQGDTISVQAGFQIAQMLLNVIVSILPSEYNITFLARNSAMQGRDFILSRDELGEVISALQRMKAHNELTKFNLPN